MHTIVLKGTDIVLSYELHGSDIVINVNIDNISYSVPLVDKKAPASLKTILQVNDKTMDKINAVLFNEYPKNLTIDPKSSETFVICQAVTKTGKCGKYSTATSYYCEQHQHQPPVVKRQCEALTCTGTRCSRSATNKYCGKHQGYTPKVIKICSARLADGHECQNKAQPNSPYCGHHAKLNVPAHLIFVHLISEHVFVFEGNQYYRVLDFNNLAQLRCLATAANIDTRGFNKPEYIDALTDVVSFR